MSKVGPENVDPRGGTAVHAPLGISKRLIVNRMEKSAAKNDSLKDCSPPTAVFPKQPCSSD
jgi:hypothetical protein